MVVDNIYGKQTGASEFSDIIRNCAYLFCTDLTNSHVKFIRRQTNEIAQNLAQTAPLEASFRIYSNIPTCMKLLSLMKCIKLVPLKKLPGEISL